MPPALITGGASFLGSHLCDRLIAEGWDVCVDSLLTGHKGNLEELLGHERFEYMSHDVTDVGGGGRYRSDAASRLPGVPVDYLRWPIETLRIGAIGTLRALELARLKNASCFLSSTSETYGDPLVHPQPETYWGNGPRRSTQRVRRGEAVCGGRHQGLPSGVRSSGSDRQDLQHLRPADAAPDPQRRRRLVPHRQRRAAGRRSRTAASQHLVGSSAHRVGACGSPRGRPRSHDRVGQGIMELIGRRRGANARWPRHRSSRVGTNRPK
jgi:hypothetical protein